MINLTDSGSVTSAAWHKWSNRAPNPAGGRVVAPISNTDALLIYICPQGASAPASPPSSSLAGVIQVYPGVLTQGTDYDTSNDIYVAANSATQAFALLDMLGFAPAGSQTVVFGPSASTVTTISAGQTVTVPPANFATGTNWTAASTPPLPVGIKAIWLNEGSGNQCTFKFDGGGSTGVIFQYVNGSFLPIPPGIDISQIYSPANGSTGLSIAAVIS
jgi:hypothetical protein